MFQVAIVGRPNVGKSTLFNRLSGARKAIVGNEPGITRDRIYGTLRTDDRVVALLDTGGLIPETRAIILERILAQVKEAVLASNLVLFVVDGRTGLTPLDEQLLPGLRKSGRTIWTVVNKIDTLEMEAHVAPFYSFGTEQVFPVSAEHGRGVGELRDAIATAAKRHPANTGFEPGEEIAVAVVGRPNVGKSSLVNRLVGFERSIVTEIPGTTRDAVDTVLRREGVRYRIIDTAGIRRKGKVIGRAEKISVLMAQKSLVKADVALLLIDAGEGVTKLDAAVGGYASESGCSVIIVLNKWDSIKKDQHTVEEFTEAVYRRMKYLAYAPVVTVSALTGQRVSKLFGIIRKAHEARHVRIPTGVLNNMLIPDLTEKLAFRDRRQNLGIRYITQSRSRPPTFVVFVAGSQVLHFSTERFLVNRLREKFGFFATPIRIRQRLKR